MLWLAGWIAPVPARSETLADAIDLAYQTNPSLLAARADQRALDERDIQAHASLGPTVSVSEQHAMDNATVPQPASFFSPATTIRQRATTDTATVTLNQPVYLGGQASSAISAAEFDVLAGRQNLRQQEATVLNQVVVAYADVLLAQDQVEIARQDVAVLTAELADTQARVDVKQLTLTDRDQARARLVASQIKLTQAQYGLNDARSRYTAAVGAAPGQLERLPDLPGLPPDVDTAFDVADSTNPQVEAAVYTEAGSRARVTQAKSADGLQVSLQASYGQQPEALNLENLNVVSLIGSLNVTKPLFTAGLHSSRVRQAIELNDRDSLRLAAVRREAAAAVAQAWSDLAGRRQQLAGLRQQLVYEQGAFKGEGIEQRVGLRTTIEVLNAAQELQATKLALVQAYHDEYIGRINLLQAVGLLQAEMLSTDITPYDPAASLKRHRLLETMLPWERLVAFADRIAAPRIQPEPSDRDALGAVRSNPGVVMPPAPQWADVEPLLRQTPPIH